VKLQETSLNTNDCRRFKETEGSTQIVS